MLKPNLSRPQLNLEKLAWGDLFFRRKNHPDRVALPSLIVTAGYVE
jgi:hypothetical protein